MSVIPEELVDICKKRMEPYPCEGFVYGRGPEQPTIMIVGEAPGETEIHHGMPFSGRAGKVLDEFFQYLGVSREDIYFTSTVRSRPYKIVPKKVGDHEIVEKKYNRAPNRKEQLAHAPILDYELQHIKPKQLVTLGNIGLQRLLGNKYTISQMHGRLIHAKVRRLKDLDSNEWIMSDDSYSIFPTFHPASIFYNRSLEKEIYKDLDKLKEILGEIY
ncbi:uracil-DNA glycosylase [Rossellomorea yichunensis]|uniref:uracil-DNA glycosylase n=1 Tax=Rossellomorea yichunensis TaxID=3077331 RepID=UPI0028E010E3|nr:uracil-DNA glycosylase [Rossellomorea sp. YC4-1]MDT9026093.1 uracil-DNA glycosylase [Rossellomorea sp. YC4-1]